MRILARIRWMAAVVLFVFTWPALAQAPREDPDRTVANPPLLEMKSPAPSGAMLLRDPGDVGGIEGYDQFGPGSWSDSGRYAVDDAGGPVDPQYRALKGVWKDTLWMKNHEDQGMMQNVSVALPDGKGGVSHGHH